MTCALGEKANFGNHILYDVAKDGNGNGKDVVTVFNVVGDRCEPKPEKCHCKTLFQEVLDLNPQVDRIDGYMKAEPFMLGCRCYLGVAARQQEPFRFVEDCEDASAGRLEFTKNDYVQICERLERAGKCKAMVKITKK